MMPGGETGSPGSGSGAAEIRPAAVADAGLIAGLHGLCFPEQPWDGAAISALMRPPRAFSFLALVGGQPAGFCLARSAADESEILTLGVDPRQRGRGIARRLLAAVLLEARERACSLLYLEVAVDNEAALALYRRSGFEVAGRRPGYYVDPDGKARDALILSRRCSE